MKGNALLTTFVTGLIGGLGFYWAGLPLPWILGPAFAVMLFNTVRPGKPEWPRVLGDAGIIIVAYLLGRTLTVGMALAIAHDLPWLLLSSAMWIGGCLLIGLFFAKTARISKASGVLGTVPGGLSQMVLIADRFKSADAGTVAILQTSRLIVVLYTVPVLAALAAAGDANSFTTVSAAAAAASPNAVSWLLLPMIPAAAWLARRVKLPAGEFLGPVFITGILAACGVTWPEVPALLIAAAQLCIGIYIGGRVNLRMLWSNKRLGPLAIFNAAVLVGIAGLAAWALAQWTEPSAVTWFLALAPGGLGEVAVTALVLGADVAHVTAYQISRLFFVLLVAPPLVRLLLKSDKAVKGRVN